MRPGLVALVILCGLAVGCGPKPEDTVMKLLTATEAGEDLLYVTKKDRELQQSAMGTSVAKSDNVGVEILRAIKARSTFQVLETKIHGDQATVKVREMVPDMTDIVVNEVLKVDPTVSNPNALELAKAGILDRIKEARIITKEETFVVHKEEGVWKVYLGLETVRRPNTTTR